MGLLRKDLYGRLDRKITELQRKNPEIALILNHLQEDKTLLTYLSLESTTITIYEGSTNDESIDICGTGLVIRDDETGVSRELKPNEIDRYAGFLGQKGYTADGTIHIVEEALERKLKK